MLLHTLGMPGNPGQIAKCTLAFGVRETAPERKGGNRPQKKEFEKVIPIFQFYNLSRIPYPILHLM